MWLKEPKLSILERNLPPPSLFHRPKNRPVSSATHSHGKCRPMGHLPPNKLLVKPLQREDLQLFYITNNIRIEPSFLAFLFWLRHYKRAALRYVMCIFLAHWAVFEKGFVEKQ